MKYQFYHLALLLLLVSSCQKDQVPTPDAKPDRATVLSGAYKVSGQSAFGGSEHTNNLPNDSLYIKKISPNVVEVTYRIRSTTASPPNEYLTVEEKGNEYYWFIRPGGYVRMIYQYDKLVLEMADGSYVLHFSKL